MSLAAQLPDFPWDTIAAAKALAATHPDGLIDLSIGTPVDPTPPLAQEALADGGEQPRLSDRPRARPRSARAQARYLRERWDVEVVPDATLPLIGTKELVAWLPTLLGLGAGDVVVYPASRVPDLSGRRAAGRL